MRKFQIAPWAFVAVMAVGLSGAPSAWALSSAGTVKLLKAQLPEGVTLASATIAQTSNALGAAVAQRPDLATTLTEVAVLAKTPKKGQGSLSCNSLDKIVGAAVNSAPDKSSDIMQMALSLHPECADSLNNLASRGPNNSTGANAPDGFNTPSDEYGGFGVGFGPSFPGSPGFVGSPPSGAIALPPGATTSTLNQ